MTAPQAVSDVSAATARITQIQSMLASLAAPSVPSSASSTSASRSFSAAMNDATTASTSTGNGTATGDAVVADAKRYLGIPYVWGGTTTSGMDCSGLVQHTYNDLGIKLPRTAAEQQQVGTPVASLADAQPGDLLFFGKPAYHVAIYAGNNKLIESPEPGKTVHITDIYQKPTSISRIVGSSLDPTPTTSSVASDGLTAATLERSGISASVARYADQFAAAEAQYHLPAGMLAAVCQQESGGNPNAVSSVGAQGLMQLMPSTAAGEGVNAFNPSQAIHAAAHILHQNLSEFGTVPLALAAYNAGAGAVREYGGIPPYSQTQNYVRSITAMMEAGG